MHVVARLREIADRIERGEAEATPALVKVLASAEPSERTAPRLSKGLVDELEWRFTHDTGPGLPYEDAIKNAVQTVRSTRRRASSA